MFVNFGMPDVGTMRGLTLSQIRTKLLCITHLIYFLGNNPDLRIAVLHLLLAVTPRGESTPLNILTRFMLV